MVEFKDSQAGKQRVTTSLKVAITIAVLSLVAVTAEQPRLSASPARQVAVTDEMVYFADVGSPGDLAAMTRPDVAARTPVAALDAAAPSTYFPGQFPAPIGDIEPPAPTF